LAKTVLVEKVPELPVRVPEPKWKKEGLRRFLNLVRTTTNDLGVTHIQYNTHDKEMLKDAQKNPENYPTLMVRVAGYSVYFNDLCTPVQDDIIARTEHKFRH